MASFLAIPQFSIILLMLLVGVINSLFVLKKKDPGRGMLFFVVFVQTLFFAVSFDFLLAGYSLFKALNCGFHLIVGAGAFARAT